MKGISILLLVWPALSLGAIQPGASESPVEAILNEDLIKALRDPFQVPQSLNEKKGVVKTDLELYQLKDFKLNGVITGPKKVRAMITAPTNKTYFIKVGDLIGARDGKVTQISNESIRVVEYFVDEHGKRVPDVYEIRIDGEFRALSKKEGE